MIEIGKLVNGRYKVIANIGSGGMANVFLAHDLILDRDVAIKILRFDFQNDQTAIRRFQREALAATEMVHPNIVGVYDVDEESGMQYREGNGFETLYSNASAHSLRQDCRYHGTNSICSEPSSRTWNYPS